MSGTKSTPEEVEKKSSQSDSHRTIASMERELAAIEADREAREAEEAAIRADRKTKEAQVAASLAELNALRADREAKGTEAAALRAETEAIKAVAAAFRAETEAIAAIRAAKDRRMKGTYYSLIDDVFLGTYRDIKKDPIQNGKAQYRNVCRPMGSTGQQFRSGSESGELVKEYDEILEAATSSLKPADSDAQSATSMDDCKKYRIWKTGLWNSCCYGAMGHLVPAKVKIANTFWFVTDFLFGYDPSRTWESRLRLLHGVIDTDTSERKDHTGIKHSVASKIYINSFQYFFAESPNVVIIPICTVEEVKAWNGDGYEVIMLIDTDPPEDYELQSDATPPNDVDVAVQADTPLARNRADALRHVCGSVLFYGDDFEIATPEEVRKAHDLVKVFTHAIAYAQTKTAPKEVVGNEGLQGILEAGSIFETTLAPLEDKKVGKLCYEDHKSGEGHPAPDPILLATRAATQLQRRHGIVLVAPEEESDDEDELSILAMEEFLRERKCVREKKLIGRDIAF
eukprot:Nitzschia sp. Nitz4//scaffold151_size53849//9541//11082//NITZ4_006714-RA/size53849-processed-gene-0.39-mRNA-1//1//CDS//3329537117//299//frame0